MLAQPQKPKADPAPKAAPPPKAAPSADTVERQLVEAVRRAPDSFQAHHALAELYLQRGKLAAALPHLERAREIDPAHEDNNHDLAVAYVETNRLEDARALLLRLLKAKESAELLNLMGDVYARAGNFVAAAEPYQRAARMIPTEEHLFDWGNNLLQLQAYQDATDVFVASIKRHPDSARLRVGLGIAQYSLGAYDPAVQSFCQAADLAPTDPRPYQFLGEMYGVSPELAGEVTTRIERFARQQPKNALAQYYYAMNLWKGQAASAAGAAPVEVDLARIEALLRRAAVLDPKFAKTFLQLGILLAEQRRYPAAIGELEKAVTLDPTLSQAFFRLGQAYQRTGQPDRAARAFARFEALKAKEAPDPKDANRPVP